MNLPYLSGPLRQAFDDWLAGTLGRFVPPLTFSELRKGVQALSSLYVERRGEGRLASRAIEGIGKRGALATYYAALHFLVVHHALRMVEPEALAFARRIVDGGCGTGAVGAAVASFFEGRPEVTGIDRSGWALEEAERTWGAFGVRGRPLRGEFPRAIPRGGAGLAYVFGWSISELDDDERDALLRKLIGALRRGSALLVVEPLSVRVSPWWADWVQKLAPLHVRDEMIRVAIDRPSFIRDMDKAARLDHQVLGARVLVGGRVKAQADATFAEDLPDDDE